MSQATEEMRERCTQAAYARYVELSPEGSRAPWDLLPNHRKDKWRAVMSAGVEQWIAEMRTAIEDVFKQEIR